MRATHVAREETRALRESTIEGFLRQGYSHAQIGQLLDPPISGPAVSQVVTRSARLRRASRFRPEARRAQLRAIRNEVQQIRRDLSAIMRQVETELAGIDIDEALAS